MKSNEVRDRIKVWRPPNLKNIELHRGTSVFRHYPRHWHEEFHLCVIESGGGELYYRGTTHHTPTRCLFIVHPGEVHSNRADETGCSYRNLYVDGGFLQDISAEIAGQRTIPFFPEAVLIDSDIIRLYVDLHQTLEGSASRLEQESLVLNLFIQLINNYAADRSSLPPAGRERLAVKKAREYLMDNFAENVSLEQLAQIVGMTPFHFTRVFSSELGLPPHAFQTQVRVLQAKTLLNQGWAICHVAQATGFADQAHLTRHFKRLIGVTPGEYSKGSKNVQDRLASRY